MALPYLTRCFGLTFLLFFLFGLRAESAPDQKDEPWASLLQRYVTADGFVDYKGLKENEKLLDRSLKKMQEKGPPGSSASANKRMAYWINAYNAFTIDLILEHYPVQSIRDIDNAFDRKFISISGKKYSLNGIEKGILLEEFDEPLVHYAVNCASVSCPPLRKEAYRADKLDQQLRDQAKRFINDPSKNRLKEDRVRVSKLYDWYEKDFTQNGTLIDHLNRYAEGVSISKDASMAFMEYDWGLNQKER